MIYILLSLILSLLAVVLFLLRQNSKIRHDHQKNINRLEAIINSLHSRQRLLNEKIIISSEYKQRYTHDMKALGDEVVELQKVFIDIISNRNYN